MEEEKDNTIDFYLAQLNKLIETKKKENKSLKTIVDVMAKNQEDKEKSSDELLKKK